MTKKRSTTFKGVTYNKKRNKWLSRIAFSGVRYSLGRFSTEEEAIAVYKKALEMGAVALKAWYVLPPEYRGNLLDKIDEKLKYDQESSKIKNFKSILNGKELQEREYRW